MSERLAGKNIFVTGGSRDIGASIVKNLIDEGANVGFCFHHPGQERYISNTRLSYILADLKTSEGREKVFEFFDQNFDERPDTLILNASDATYELNVEANLALVRKFMELRKNGGGGEGNLVLIQSVPGHFYDRLGNGGIPKFYIPIAKAKNRGEGELLRLRSQFTQTGTNFFIICPPAVVDTTNWIQFKKRRDTEVDIKHKKITDSLGLPEQVLREDVGQKVAQLLIQTPRFGHVEYFNSTLDGKAYLSDIYGPSLRLPDTFNIEERCAWMIVTSRHCRDHFLGKPILPGFLIEEAAAQVTALIVSGGDFGEDMPILDERSITGLRVMGATTPGDILKFALVDFISPRRREFIAELLVTNLNKDGSSTLTVKGIFYPRRWLR